MAEATLQAAATAISNLVVTPQTTAVSVAFTSNNAVRARLQIGPSSGTYTTFTGGLESVAGTAHLLQGYGLAAGTLYHYIVSFFDAFGNALDATTDATFTTSAAPAGGAAPGAIIGGLLGGTGVPAASMGQDGNYFFRYDGPASNHIYFKSAGAWTALV
jgi:hypothetical protein